MTELEVLRSFERQPNGMWACARSVKITGPAGEMSIGPGMSFSRGASFMGVNLAEILDNLALKYGV
jgi:hypothetical protein